MKVFYTLVIIVFITACASKNVPANVLPEEKMEKILWELLEAEEWAIHEYPLDTIARKRAMKQHFVTIYQINNTDPEQFSSSYQYYSSHPTRLSPVLDSLRNRAMPEAVPMPDSRPRKGIRPL